MLGDRRLCGCGSGLRAARCCEMRPAHCRPGAGRPLSPLVERAAELLRQNAVEEARGVCLDVLELAPGHPDALALLYQICRNQGSVAATEALLRRIVALLQHILGDQRPDLADMSKGAVLRSRAPRPQRHPHRAGKSQAHNLMGMVLTEANRPHTGEYHYRKVIELMAGVTRSPSPTSLELEEPGRMEEARGLYEEAAGGDANLHTLLGWARMEEADRNLDGALGLLDRAEQVAPDNPAFCCRAPSFTAAARLSAFRPTACPRPSVIGAN